MILLSSSARSRALSMLSAKVSDVLFRIESATDRMPSASAPTGPVMLPSSMPKSALPTGLSMIEVCTSSRESRKSAKLSIAPAAKSPIPSSASDANSRTAALALKKPASNANRDKSSRVTNLTTSNPTSIKPKKAWIRTRRTEVAIRLRASLFCPTYSLSSSNIRVRTSSV